MFQFLIRLISLGLVVFISLTTIPSQIPSLQNRLIVSAVVAIVYGLIDWVTNFLESVKKWLCQLTCDNYNGDFDNNQDFELPPSCQV